MNAIADMGDVFGEGLFGSPQDADFETSVYQSFGALDSIWSRFKPCELSLYCDQQARAMPGTCKAHIPDGQAWVATISTDFKNTSCNFGSICIDQICRSIRFEGESYNVSGHRQDAAD